MSRQQTTALDRDLNRDLKLDGINSFIRDEVPDQVPVKEMVNNTQKELNKGLEERKDQSARKIGLQNTSSNIPSKTKAPVRPQSSKMGHAAPKRKLQDGEEVVFMVKDLEKENLALKEKENLLEREVLKMQTKMRRIDELIRGGKTYNDGDFASLHNELEDQFDQIRDENDILKDRVRKLKTIQKGLSSKDFKQSIAKASKTTTSFPKVKQTRPSSSYKASKTASRQPEGPLCDYHRNMLTSTGMNKGTFAQRDDCSDCDSNHERSTLKAKTSYGGFKTTSFNEDLRSQLVKIQREINRLTNDKEQLSSTSTGNMKADDILRKIQQRDKELRDFSRQYEDLEQGFVNKEQIFKGSKTYMEELLKKIREQRITNETLKQQNLSLQIRAQQSNSLNDHLKDIEAERDSYERSIRNLTSEPFFRREKGDSTLKRIADLEERVLEKERTLRALKEQEVQKQNEFQTIKTNKDKLVGERDYLKQENEKLRGKFTNEHQAHDINIFKTLFKMDPKRYGETMSDIMAEPDNVPIWADMDFLERGQEQIDPNNLKALKVEILKIRHENKDFAAELEKAQNLHRLQTDIEKENTQYFEAELHRLNIISKSTSVKAEELARRADEKARQINDISQKLGLPQSRQGSPEKTKNSIALSQTQLDILETQSEFSAMTNESEIRTDENVLDFVLQDAEYYFDAFNQVLDQREMTLHQKTLITFVTVDFYNHNTETSQIAEGYKPLYNTQFSFKNKIDDFYVQYLQKQTMKLDFYISKNNAAIHIGKTEIFLKEIIERETAVQELSFKTPVIQKTIRIFPIGSQGSEQPVGMLRFKMRMRRPITEAMRFYREKNEIANLNTLGRLQEEGADYKSRKKLITFEVVGCKDLKVKYSELTKIAPFFYYHFYTFDERYSETHAGENPMFNDSQTYDVTFDAKIISYLQKENLEIILFDDNAPVTGVERGGKALTDGQQIDDMIGIAKVPLVDLIKGATIHDRFMVRNLKGDNCGQIEVKITIIDLDSGFTSIGNPKLQSMLAYNKQWENDIIYRIAQKLAKFPADSELLFGVFSRGQKTVSKEDFKYCVLQRLNLRKEINDKEMDLFLRGSPQLADKEYIDKNDFLMLFTSAIAQARNEMQNEEAMQYTTIKKYEELQKSASFKMNQSVHQQDDEFSRSVTPLKDFKEFQSSTSNMNFNEQEVMQIMSKIKDAGRIDWLFEKVKLYTQGDSIMSKDLIMTLLSHGSVTEIEARRVSLFLEIQGKVKVAKFQELFDRASQFYQGKSLALKKFNDIIVNKGDAIAQKLLQVDYNRDGQISVDGLIAALLIPDFAFKTEEVREVFSILNKGDLFYYRDYLLQVNPQLRLVFNQRPASTLGKSDTRQSLVTESISLSSAVPVEDPRLRIVKQKLKNYIQVNDITLASLFNLIDSDSNQVLSASEFQQKMKLLQVNLDDDELRVLFKALDKAGTGSITYKQFVTEFPEINVSYMVKKIKNIIIGSKVSIDLIYEKYCTDKKTNKMSQQDFKRFIKFHHEKAQDHEIDSLFKHFDPTQKGFITKEEFVAAFGRDVKEQIFRINIEDIIKPLATKIKKFNVNIATLFDTYDQNHNGRLSGQELARALKADMNIQLLDEDVQIIVEYFKNKHNMVEITKSHFIDLISTKFERVSDAEEAKQSLTTLKQKLQSLGQTGSQILSFYDTEKISKVTLRNFKVAVNNLHALNQYSIDNLARFLDKENDGFISINEFELNVRQSIAPLSSTGSFSMSQSTKRKEKWGQ